MVTKKIRLYPILPDADLIENESERNSEIKKEKDRVYQYLRDAMYWQNKAYNLLLSAVYSKLMVGDYDGAQDLYKKASRNPGTKKDGGSFWTEEFDFKKMICTPSTVQYAVKSYFKSSSGKEVLKGNESLQNVKRTAPLQILKKSFEFYCDPGFDVYSKDAELFFRLGSKREDGCYFKVDLGTPGKSNEFRHFMGNVVDGTYKICDSKIMIDNKKKIILLLCVDVPKKNPELDENTVVGVDLGVSVPAVCALNNGFGRKYIGSGEDFVKRRNQMDSQRKELQRGLVLSQGGHGRERKMRRLERLKHSQKEWSKSVDHKISKDIVDFAVKHNAATIQMEDLSGLKDDERFGKVFRNWSYYRLQNNVKYKAEKYGIQVVLVNPCYTTQVCAECGAIQENRYTSQSSFVCPNPDCVNGRTGRRVNPDYNAARNIAKSTLYTTGKESEKVLLAEAKKYYNVKETSDSKKEGTEDDIL